MARPTELYGKFDLDFTTDDHYMALISLDPVKGNLAYLYLLALAGHSQMNRTDGVIPILSAHVVAHRMGLDGPALLQELAARPVAMVILKGVNVILPKFAKWGRTRAELDQRAAVNRANGATGGRPPGNPDGLINETQLGSETETESVMETKPTRKTKRNPNARATARGTALHLTSPHRTAQAPAREEPEGAKEEAPPSLVYDEETNAILSAFMELTGRAGFSGDDLQAAQQFLVDCPRQSAEHITQRMEQYAVWRRENGHKPSRRLADYSDTLAKEEAYLTDAGARKVRGAGTRSFDVTPLADVLARRVG